MKLAFCLFNYFPFGGLQRDFLRIAQECLQRGHTVDVYTYEWQGEQPPELTITIIPVRGLQNHTRRKQFIQHLQPYLKKQVYDLVVGFNKMPGLDIYYAADTCFQAKARKKQGAWYRLTPRYQQSVALEKSVFSLATHTEILLLAEKQRQDFIDHYQTPMQRFHLLPPGIAKDRIAPENAADIRIALRHELNMTDREFLLLMIGSGFKTKGLDRVLLAIAHLPTEIKNRCHFFILGKDHAAAFQRQAEQLQIAERIHFLGGRDDVPRFLLAADILLHPAYNENTGTVLLEALTSGLPVITTDVCGYAHYVTEAQAGKVLPSPFVQPEFDKALSDFLLLPNKNILRKNALTFAKQADIYSLPERTVDLFDQIKKNNSRFDDIMQLRGEVFRELEGRRTQRIIFHQQNCFIKQHFGVGWKEIFKNLFQLRLPILSAKNEWRALQRLSQLNIATPEIIHYGCRGKNPAALQSFLITRELPAHISLEDFCRDWKTNSPSFLLKQELLKKVASIARTLHQNGINHRDFYICHFLLDKDLYENHQIKLYLIDLHRAQIRKTIPPRWIIKDIAGLYFSSKDIGLTQRDYFRFIKWYRATHHSLRAILNKEKTFWLQVKNRGDKLYQEHAN